MNTSLGKSRSDPADSCDQIKRAYCSQQASGVYWVNLTDPCDGTQKIMQVCMYSKYVQFCFEKRTYTHFKLACKNKIFITNKRKTEKLLMTLCVLCIVFQNTLRKDEN